MDEFEAEAQAHLRTLTGRDDAEFRSGQLDAIRSLVADRRRVLVVERTGWGKSAVYFIATRMLRDSGLGATLLVSPLIALMDNQVQAAARMGLRAAVVNSTNHDAWDEIRERLDAGEIDLLLISEMRLANQEFRQEWLPKLGGRVGLVVIDEVHCISDWGHDFRPHYRRIGRFLRLLPAGVPVIGCTATANDRVIDDVQAQLGDDLLTVRGGLTREGLKLEVHNNKRRADARLAWLAENIPQLPSSGIVYCLTRRDVDDVADFLRSQGISCGAYKGGGDKVEAAEKEATLQAFVDNEIKCVVATAALGMGYDKPDVGFVIHYQLPQSPIAYYQQVGRAGRALDESYGILLAGSEDRDIQDWFIENAFPSEEEVAIVLEVLDEADDPVRPAQLAVRANMGTGRIENLLVQLEVEGAVARVPKGWERTLSAWTYPTERVHDVNAWRRHEQAAMEEYLITTDCRMRFLRRLLDDSDTSECGVCDNCRGERFGVEPDVAVLGEADVLLRNHHVEIEPRKQWARGLEEPTGNIPAGERTEPGWCLSRWGTAGWGDAVRLGLETGVFDPELVAAVVDMCGELLEVEPAWLTYVPSLREPYAVPAFAEQLAEALGIPLVALVVKTRETRPQKEMRNSATQLTNIWGSFAIEGEPPEGAGLLIDDLVDSRWTMTVVGSLLRQAGAESITPIALGSMGQ